MQDPNDKSSIDKIYQDIKDLFTVNSETFVAEFDKIATAGNRIQTVFTQGRQRNRQVHRHKGLSFPFDSRSGKDHLRLLGIFHQEIQIGPQHAEGF
jgi:hypothetical protein